MRHFTLLSALVLAVVGCSDTPLATAPDGSLGSPQFSTVALNGYTAIDLGTFGGSFSIAYDINEAGHVVGAAETASGDRRAFLWVDGVMYDLGTLGGTESWAYAINNQGQVAGWSFLSNGDRHAFLWEDGTMYDLGAIETFSLALGMNELGNVVGYGSQHAFLWENGTLLPLETPTGDRTIAYDLNTSGVIVGALSQGPQRHVARWVGGTLENLGTLGGGYGEARGINEPGQIVGWSRVASGLEHAFLWEAGTLHDLGTLGGARSGAEDLNDRGQIAGWSQLSDGVFWAVVWNNGTPTILPSLGEGGSDGAAAISESGQLAGVSQLLSGERRATLWRVLTPVEQLAQCAAMVTDLEAQGVLNQGQAHSLVNKINLATANLNDGKNTPAINKLEAFINEVEAMMLGQHPVLTPEQGEPLGSCVQVVIDAIGS